MNQHNNPKTRRLSSQNGGGWDNQGTCCQNIALVMVVNL